MLTDRCKVRKLLLDKNLKMENKWPLFLCMMGIVLCQAWIVHSAACERLQGSKGNVEYRYKTSNRYSQYEFCWKISVPPKKVLHLNVTKLIFYSKPCNEAYLQVEVDETKEVYTFCSFDESFKSVSVSSDVTIKYYYKEKRNVFVTFGLDFQFEFKDYFKCPLTESFNCGNFFCISEIRVCDGIVDCESGIDEKGCGIDEARKRSVAWLISERSPSWGWEDNTPRAITSLFLAGAANFNGSNIEEELMAKNAELMTSVFLLKNSISKEKLSMFINSLLVSCHDPRRFYGKNLVNLLMDQVESADNFTHPAAYLALCNTNESWPEKAAKDLINVLSKDSKYPFVTDIQAFALMAISCTKIRTKQQDSQLLSLYQKTIDRFKQLQMTDGSFGNVHTTALVAQALISSEREHTGDWNLNTTTNFLIKELQSLNIDVYTMCLTLPILNMKSLSDIAKVDCTSNPRKHRNGDVANDINNYAGPKMNVQYSLFVSNEDIQRDVIHSMFFRVPENSTAYNVMKWAEVENPKYKFEGQLISGQNYIYSIGKISNDAELGKFWLSYLGSSNSYIFNTTTTSPIDQVLQNDDHLIMWYRQIEIY